MKTSRVVSRCGGVAVAGAAVGALASKRRPITDGLMMARGQLCTGFVYDHDQWSNYWEGALKRDNGNIGTLTTQSRVLGRATTASPTAST